MKSLLVDALRKAGDQGGSSSPQVATEEGDAAAPAAPPQSDAPSEDEAVLLPVLNLSDDESLGGDDNQSDELLGGDANRSDELVLAPELDIVLDSPPAGVVDVATVANPALPVTDSATYGRLRETNWLHRTARWSPLLYLLALSTAAASYYGYQRFALAVVSTDLGSMPTQLAYSDRANLEPGNAWTALPDSESLAPAAKPQLIEQNLEPPAASATSRPAERAPTTGPKEPADPVLSTLREAYTAYGTADYAGAESLYQRVLEVRPFHAQALLGLSAALQRQGKRHAARSTYEQLLKVEPDNPAAAASLVALVEQDSADAGAAETQLKLLAPRHPRVPEIRAALGRFYAHRQQWPEAYEAYVEAASMQPASADYHYNAAVCAENLGRLRLAREHYAAALHRSHESAAFDTAAVAAHLAALGQREGSR